MENKTLTAVEWLAEKYNYITWMRNRDEMSAKAADKYRKDYLEEAKQIEKEQMKLIYSPAIMQNEDGKFCVKTFEQYYNKTYGKE